MALWHCTVFQWVLQTATLSRHPCDLWQVSSLLHSSWGFVCLSTSVSLSVKKRNLSPGWCGKLHESQLEEHGIYEMFSYHYPLHFL